MHAGVSVIAFNDPIEAIEHFTANPLVISDLRMPGLNGLATKEGKKIKP